jgi:hypothetical protein
MNIIAEEPRIVPSKLLELLRNITFCARASIRDFGVVPTLRTTGATLTSLIRQWRRENLPYSPGVTIITFTIHPDLARIWHWWVTKTQGASANVWIVDCSGRLNPKKYPGATVKRFCNFQHGRKIDYWIYHVLKTEYVWLSDDDVFPVAKGILPSFITQFQKEPLLAAISFRPRGWELEWSGEKQRCMGPYSLLFNRRLFCTEGLSFRWVKTDDERIAPGRTPGRFDVADYAHYQLMQRRYHIVIAEERNVLGFVGVSRALLRTIRTRGNVKDYIVSQLSENPNHALGEIEAQYCSWLVHDLYSWLFGEKPSHTPPIARGDLLELASKISGSMWTDPVSRLTRWDEEYASLLAIAEEVRL